MRQRQSSFPRGICICGGPKIRIPARDLRLAAPQVGPAGRDRGLSFPTIALPGQTCALRRRGNRDFRAGSAIDGAVNRHSCAGGLTCGSEKRKTGASRRIRPLVAAGQGANRGICAADSGGRESRCGFRLRAGRRTGTTWSLAGHREDEIRQMPGGFVHSSPGSNQVVLGRGREVGISSTATYDIGGR